jgi:hypothetical protein
MIALDASLARHFPALKTARPPRLGPLARLRARLRERRALRDLLLQPDSVLRDFGTDRATLRREAAGPF